MAEQQVQPLHNEKHANTKIKNGINLEFLKTQHLVPVVAHEFGRVANEFPMAFVKNNETGKFQAVAIFGLEPGENLFVDGDQWVAGFAPLAVTRYPLGLVKHPEEEQYGVVIDEASPLVGEEDGNALFENGEETEYLKRRKDALVSFIEFSGVTETFTQYLADKELLVPQTLTVDIKGEKKDISGIYLIDEKKLNELSDEAFLELRKRGYLAPIYSFLTSTHQVGRLARLKAQRDADA
ncbi:MULTISPECIES: SapC family protein [Pseudoalteromonas]|uniref:Multidrug transporter n=1 Tax=Pseudoalteromonas ruthenica TaxID=151081 RepID=A0A0F4PIL4_9GAMM|nr:MULTISPECIES: SapC family protein [Pseudoalteromonas]KJY95237.1 multidrug transporter [Pseudoalteromonas ruthenica]KJY96170.1 multidrug transporter [Pseudoalteromonas ruthenica]MCF2863930.1 SapC family protein [Pseudoalteromonas sp. CNAT2-18]MCG7558597.1 SapC family protein [Pseudoalteromonas sp. CNAT2-18.1]MCG7565382.1 SapC family protein [Pseudoalteromonas sp. CnMc7-15]